MRTLLEKDTLHGNIRTCEIFALHWEKCHHLCDIFNFFGSKKGYLLVAWTPNINQQSLSYWCLKGTVSYLRIFRVSLGIPKAYQYHLVAFCGLQLVNKDCSCRFLCNLLYSNATKVKETLYFKLCYLILLQIIFFVGV